MTKHYQPRIRELLVWLTSITRPVHKPLYLSTMLRIINLSLEITLFSLAGAAIVATIESKEYVWTLLVCLIVAALAKAGAYYGEQFSGHYVAFKALELLRTHVFSQLWPKAPSIVTRSHSGDILTSLTRDVDRIEVVYAHTFAPVVSAYIVPVTAVCVAGSVVGWDIVIVPAVCVALSLFLVPFVGLRSALKHTRTTLARRRALVHHLSDSVFGTEEVVSYGRQEERMRQTEELGKAVAQAARIPSVVSGVRRSANLTLMLISVLAIVYVGINHAYPLSTIVILASGSLRLFVGAVGVEDAAAYLDHSFAAARRLWDICHEENVVCEGDTVLKIRNAPSVTFECVFYAYPERSLSPDSTEKEQVDVNSGVNGDEQRIGQEKPKEKHYALKNVTVHIPAGKRTVFVGVSGSGKSTAMQLLARYDDPSEGKILIDGCDISTYTFDSLRECVVSVAQKNQLLNMSVRDNVTLGAPYVSDGEIWDVLETVGVADEVRAMGGGLDTDVGQGGTRLSGGQAQRLCLARALLMKPHVLVLDEFTSALNVELEQQIREAIAAFLPDVTIIEVTHRIESAQEADHVVVMDRGRVIAQGNPKDVLAVI